MTLLIYLLGIVNTIKSVFGAAAGVTGLVLVSTALALVVDASDRNTSPNWKKYLPSLKKGGYLFLVLLTIAVFVPGQKTLAAMYVIPKIASNERLQNLADGSMSVLEGYIKGWAEDMAPEKGTPAEPVHAPINEPSEE